MSSPGSARPRPLRELVRGCRYDDRATVGAKPWDVGQQALIRGVSHVRMFVWGCPCLRTGVDLSIGLTAQTGIPLPWLRPRRCTKFVFAGPLPRHGSLEQVLRC